MKKYDACRRNFMKTSIAGAAIGTLGLLSGRAGQAVQTQNHQFRVAGYDYDRPTLIERTAL